MRFIGGGGGIVVPDAPIQRPKAVSSSEAPPAHIGEKQRAPLLAHASSSWPRDFTCHEAALCDDVKKQIRHDLLHARPEAMIFVPAGKSAVALSRTSKAGSFLGALAECGAAGCSCSRLTQPRVRARFRETIVELVLAVAAGDGGADGRAAASPSLHYVSLASGLLLPDAEILSGLVEAGATILSVGSVDSGYSRPNNERDLAALSQLGGLVAPASLTAYASVGSFVAASATHGRRANLVVASDPATDVARVFKRFASAVLRDGGLAFLLLNGGPMGASTRVWRRRPACPPPGVATSTSSTAISLATSDAALGLEELEVPGHAVAAAREGEMRLRELFDRDCIEDFVRCMGG